MIIQQVSESDFIAKRRDSVIDYQDYAAKAQNLIKRIPNAARNLTDPEWLRDADTGMLLSMTAARGECALDLISLSYSAGADMGSLRAFFPDVLDYYEEYALYSEAYNASPEGMHNPGPHIAIADVEFTRASRLLCFAILLGWQSFVPRIMSIIEYNNPRLDAMLERLASVYTLRPQPLPAECTRHLPYYKTLAIFNAPPSQRSELMREYLGDWYHASRREPYYDSHTKAKRYLGYWSWESAAITVALDIDDALYREMSFYPREAVAFHSQLGIRNQQVKGSEPMDARAKAGEPCPIDGVWESIGIPVQQVQYAQGAPMKDLGSPYGLTVWRRLEQ